MSLLDVRAISNQSKLGDQHYSHAMVKHNPQDSINENYLKMNSLVVATTNLNLHSSMCNEKLIFHNDFSVFIHIEKSLKTFTSNSRKPELVEIS